MQLSVSQVVRILTRTSGFLATVSSHTLQPYRGCALGNSLCGVGCYVRHNRWLTRGRPWGSFVEARTDAPKQYVAEYESERRWAHKTFGRMSVFLSSSTEPFQPAEDRHHVTRDVLTAMLRHPPDELVLQTHSHRVADHVPLLRALSERLDLRVHISVETDRDSLPGLPPAASTVARRIETGRQLKAAGVRVVATVAPLLPIDDPNAFFGALAIAFDAVVIDHFVGGDGSASGTRTRRTALPAAMEALRPGSSTLAYREEMIAVATRLFGAGRVGVGIDGFGGRYLKEKACRESDAPLGGATARSNT